MRQTHLADSLVSSLSERFPPELGHEAYRLIKKRLRSEGFFDDFHAEEVLSMALTSAMKYLRNHEEGEIRSPRAWFHTLCRHACVEYLKHQRLTTLTFSLSSVIAGEVELSAAFLPEESTLIALRRAIQQLRPRLQQLIILDLVECLPPAKIQEAMQLPSNGAFRKLKHEAFRGLREAVRVLIDKGIGQLFYYPMSDRELGGQIPERRTVGAECAGRTPPAGECRGVGQIISDKARAQAVPTELARTVASQGGAISAPPHGARNAGRQAVGAEESWLAQHVDEAGS